MWAELAARRAQSRDGCRVPTRQPRKGGPQGDDAEADCQRPWSAAERDAHEPRETVGHDDEPEKYVVGAISIGLSVGK